jgi:conjugal transfer pilus assembly protein TraW
MNRFAVALIACFSASLALAEDLGAIGPTYPIAERDLMEVFKARAQARVDDGTWGKVMQQQTEKMKAYAARPIGKRLPRALEYSVRFFDPTIVLEDNISDQDGKILFQKGTRVNPFDYRNYQKTLCFLDGDDEQQVEWAKAYCLDPLNAKAILTNGPIIELSNRLKARLFFDQYARLVSHFGIKALPTVVRQSGKVFAIEEFGVGP